MKVGFTGTREGMTEPQKASLRRFLDTLWLERLEVHHGLCAGADGDFHALCRAIGARIVGHPAFPVGHPMRLDLECDELRDVLPPLERNAVIVAETILLLATPAEQTEQQRSATWATIRAARNSGIARHVFYPCGRVVVEREHGASDAPLELVLQSR